MPAGGGAAFSWPFLPVRKNRAGALKILITVKFTVGFNGIC